MEYKKSLQKRVARWRAFHEHNEPGDLLVFIRGNRGCNLPGLLCTKLCEGPVEKVLDPENIPRMIAEYVGLLRESFENVSRFDDDAVPSAVFYCGIGVNAAAITGLEPFHDGVTSWLEPSLRWEKIDQLRFDPSNKWIQFALRVNRELWKHWDEDFHVLPFLHRSPLDAANGIRGTELFTEMYTDPQRVHRLVDFCAEWMLQVESFLNDNVRRPCPKGWGTAVWGTWLPDGGLFVNGDPVGLISREMALEFEQPYTAKLFTNTGGGFFHNHTVGLYQADLVSSTPGTLMQFFVNDPKEPSTTAALLDMPKMREKLLAASLRSPIAVAGVPVDRLDEVLDVAAHGRFLLVIAAKPETPDRRVAELIRRVRAVSNLD
ncbi:MAG: hypothetical protein ACYTF6_08355 [Planctomycetota bacterium]